MVVIVKPQFSISFNAKLWLVNQCKRSLACDFCLHSPQCPLLHYMLLKILLQQQAMAVFLKTTKKPLWINSFQQWHITQGTRGYVCWQLHRLGAFSPLSGKSACLSRTLLFTFSCRAMHINKPIFCYFMLCDTLGCTLWVLLLTRSAMPRTSCVVCCQHRMLESVIMVVFFVNDLGDPPVR